MTASRVALVHGDSRRENILQALDLVGDQIDWGSRHSVLIKPNFVSLKRALAVTHVEAVRALLDWLRPRYSGPIVIGEGTPSPSTWEAFARHGFLGLPEEYPGVELRDLNSDESSPVWVFDRSLQPMELQVARTSLESDCRIAIGPPKTHDSAIVTLGLKNMIMGSIISRLGDSSAQHVSAGAQEGNAGIGSPSRKRRGFTLRGRGLYGGLPVWVKRLALMERLKARLLYHSAQSDKQRMHQSLPLLNLNLFALAPLLHPHLSILDGWQAMEGDGPVWGDAVDWRVAVSSADFLAADALASELMGFPVSLVGYLHYCRLAGLGASTREAMDIVGNVPPEAMQRSFRPSPTARMQRKWRLRDTDRLLDEALRLNATSKGPIAGSGNQSGLASEETGGEMLTLPLRPAGQAHVSHPVLEEHTA